MRFSTLPDADVDVLCIDLFCNATWCCIASAVLIVRYYQGLLYSVSYILLLFCWFVWVSGGGYVQYSRYCQILAQLFQSFRDMTGESNQDTHWTYNIAEVFISTALYELQAYVFPHWILTGTIFHVVLCLLVYGHPVFQLFVQKQITQISRLIRCIFQWRDYAIEYFWYATSHCLNDQAREVVNVLWGACHQVYQFLNTKTLNQIQYYLAVSGVIYPLLFGFATTTYSWFGRAAGLILFYRLFLRELARFSNPKPLDYKYTELEEPDHIRLVLLHPRLGFRRISCSMVQGPPLRVCIYEAISYRWGSEDRTEEILVDGCKMKVTQSVYEILATYSSHFLPQLLWIDAICIDQDNKDEKAEQVPMMDVIYSSALFTTVFLGQSPLPEAGNKKRGDMLPYRFDGVSPQDGQTRQHFKTARLTFDLFNDFRILQKPLRRRGKDIYELYELLSFSASKHDQWQALTTFLRHPWFTRVWVVQEVALSPNVKVRYGDEIIDWETIASALGTIHSQRQFRLWLEWSHKLEIWRTEHSSLFNFIRINKLRQQYSLTKDISITLALAQSHYFKAKNSRDQVYGLMSLCRDRKFLRVDYKAKEEDVYRAAAAELVQRKSFRQLFGFAGVGNRSESGSISKRLPSWVPDWTDAPKYDCIFRPNEDPVSYNFSLMWLQRRLPGMQPLEPFIVGDRALKISAKLVDIVADVGTALFEKAAGMQGGGVINEMCCLWNSYRSCRDFIFSSRFTSDPYSHDAQPQSLLDAFHCSIVTGHGVCLSDWVCDLQRFSSKLDTDSPASRENIYKVLQTMDAATRKVESCCGARRLFVSSKGWIGLCPPGTRKGDGIWAACGVDIPIVLRKADGESNYKLVGECYCHGLGTGELESTPDMEVMII